MKKTFLTLSLTTALSTAFLTTLLPTTNLQASAAAVAVLDFGLTEAVGIKLNPSIPADDSLRETDQEIVALLKEHFSRDAVVFDYNGVRHSFVDDVLNIERSNRRSLTKASDKILVSLQTKIRGWLQVQNEFLEAFALYYNNRRDLTLLKLVNTNHQK